MKKKLVLGSLIITSIMQVSVPAQADKEAIGNIIGGIIGGGLGTQIGKGNGNKAAIIIGAIAGTMIGGKIGSNMDEADRRALEEAQRNSLRGDLGRRHDWDGRQRGSRTGARGSFTSSREGYNNRTGEYCREYTSVITMRDRREETRGIACSRPDGSWYEVRETEVRFGGRNDGRNDNRGNGGGRHNGGPVRPQEPSRPIPPPSPVQSRNEGSVQINQVTRRSGGEWYRLTLRNPVNVENVEVRALAAGVRVHEAQLYTVSGNRIQIRELTNSNTIYAGDRVTSENLYARDRVQVIDIRVESMGGAADILVKVFSADGRPSMDVSRF